MSNYSLHKLSVSIFIVFSFLITPLAKAKSLYVIEHKGPRDLIAFEIVEDQLVFQHKVVLPKRGLGPVDVACDESTGTLFVVYETRNDPCRYMEVFNEGLVNVTVAGILYM